VLRRLRTKTEGSGSIVAISEEESFLEGDETAVMDRRKFVCFSSGAIAAVGLNAFKREPQKSIAITSSSLNEMTTAEFHSTRKFDILARFSAQ
jgi:hypothetical protein